MITTLLRVSRALQISRLRVWGILIHVFFVGFLTTDCWPQNQNILWSENWERTNWTDDWHVDNGLWEVGVPTSGPDTTHNGQKCAATVLGGNYSDYADTRLIRHTSFVVPSQDQNPRLRFWHWYSFNLGDYGQVQISTNRGMTWSSISSAYTSTSSGVWTYPSIDLSDYAGLTVQIAFFFHAEEVFNTGGPDVSTGWYIDDVALITGSIVFNNPENFESGIGDWAAERGTWEVGKPTVGPSSAYSPPNCAGTVLNGDYADYVDSRLLSPPFVVPSNKKNPALRFWHWFSFNLGDFGEVQIKVGKGSWKAISNRFVNTSAGTWTPFYVSLSDYADSTAQIGFYFHAEEVFNTGGPDVSTGWYIDDLAIGGLATNVDDRFSTPHVINTYNLSQNYPNPFNPETTIEYELPRAGQIEITIFNLLGEKVRALVNHHQASGQHRVQWDGRDDKGNAPTSGVYFYRLRAGDFVQTRKMILTQ